MKELSSYELCLLIYLCYKSNRKSFSPANDTRKDECFRIWDKLRNIVNTHCGSEVISVIESAGLEITTTRKTLLIKVVNKTLLEKFLDEYCNYMEEDALDSYNYNNLNFNRLDSNFKEHIATLKASINKNNILKEYFIDDTKYLPIILWGLRNKLIGFKDVSFSLAPNEEQLDKIPKIELRKRKLRNNCSDMNIIDFGILLDLSNFIKLRGLRRTETKVKSKNTSQKIDLYKYKLRERDWRIFFTVKYAVENLLEGDSISVDKSLFIATKALTEASCHKQLTEFNTRIKGCTSRLDYKMNLLQTSKDNSKYDIDMLLYTDFNNLKTPHILQGRETYKGILDKIYQEFTIGKFI